MGDGTEENPLTREDVLRLIKENGGTAKGLDLSEKIFEGGINLGNLDLKKIILRDATLYGAHLEGAILEDAHLEGAYLADAYLEGAKLWGAHLEGAKLLSTHLKGANLSRAHLEGAWLFDVKFPPDTELENADWGNYILGWEKRGHFGIAEGVYRRLKQWYTNAGMYDRAGEFFFREMTARRKNYWWQGSRSKSFRKLLHPFKPKELSRAIFPGKPFQWALSELLSVLCGYGERPLRVVISAAVVVSGLATAYYLWGSFSSFSFWDTLYYSAVSFTALGYGLAPQPTGWAKGAGAAEAFVGVFMIALFLITFTRKMTR